MRRFAIFAAAIALACGTAQSSDAPAPRETCAPIGPLIGPPALLPNGATVVSRAGDAPGESDLVLIEPSGAMRTLVPAPGPDDMPTALPDGRVAFVSGRTGRASLYVVDPASDRLTQLTNQRAPFVPTPVRRIEVDGATLRWDAGDGQRWELEDRDRRGAEDAMKLRVALLLLSVTLPAAAQQYRFPIELPGSGTQPYVTAYRDHAAGGGLQDWNCGTETYDGHKGTDFGIGSWPVMDSGSRWIVAAAPGTVAFVNDGCFDHCSTADCNCGSGFGNYVKLTHADGKSTYYGHMMINSIVVGVGDQVGCGQHLGKVGSSGFSTGPHLHFEPRYSDNTSDDPFSGPCGGPTSFWVSQNAYKSLPADQCENPQPPDVDDAKQVSETIAAGTGFSPGEIFDKTWTIENTGTTTWSKPSYVLAYDSGETFGVSAPIDLADGESIAPGAQKTFLVTLTAPTTPGTYAANFRMDHTSVARFGELFHVEINVASAGGSGGADGGAGWSSGGAKIDSGVGNAGSGAGSQKTKIVGDDEGGGCGCRTSPREAPSPFFFAAAALWMLRKRRRS